MSDLLRRLFTETWPAKAAKSAIEALMLPGQIAGGELATQPSAPGMWSDVDEARSQATQQGIGNRATDLAGLLMGGSYAAPAQRNAVGSGIRAYHGSPHDFDRFDLSKIGTGEGAQSYGHGLYFAGNEAVAKAYREALAGTTSQKFVNGQEYNRDNPVHLAAHLADVFKSRDKALQVLQDDIKKSSVVPERVDVYRQAAEILRGGSALGEYTRKQPGRMYEVNINARPEQFLDWDKPLRYQNQPVAEALKTVGVDVSSPNLGEQVRNASGLRLHGTTWGDTPYPVNLPDMKSPAASNALNKAGIPGIKYLDQGSRGAGEGSRNYVVFDDKLIDILRKYGLAGAAGPLGALLMGGGGDAQAQPTAP